MSRPLRIEWPGGLYHVTSRGDRREPIVEDDADRQGWVQLLAETCWRFNWRVHAYCLMTNHYHVVVETPEGNLSLGMRHLNGVWSQLFNRRHGRLGHVFQGRFKAIIVQRESYLLELARYVVLNPVRAGMVNSAGDYAWSSYRATVDAASARVLNSGEETQPWFVREWLLAQFSPVRAQAEAAYVDFVRAGVGLPSVWEQLQGQVFLGSREFLREMQARLAAPERLPEVPLAQRRPARVPIEQWQLRYPRDEAIVQACRSGHYRQAEVAAHLHRPMTNRYQAKGETLERKLSLGMRGLSGGWSLLFSCLRVRAARFFGGLLNFGPIQTVNPRQAPSCTTCSYSAALDRARNGAWTRYTVRWRPLLAVLASVGAAANSSLAGEQTGTVRMDHGRYASGPASPGFAFFVLQGGAKANRPACNTYIERWVINNAWPAARMQIAILLTAVASGKTVTVRGSGDCAVYLDSETAVDIRLNGD